MTKKEQNELHNKMLKLYAEIELERFRRLDKILNGTYKP